MMADFLTCHDMYNRYTVLCMKSVAGVCVATVRSCQQVPSVYAVEKFQQLWSK